MFHIQRKLRTFKEHSIYILLLFFICACHEEDRTILPPDIHLQTGDIVFRQGIGLGSQAVLSADRSGCYSHIGIVVDSSGCPMIVHAVPDEHDFEGDTDRIKMDTPETFFLESRAAIGEVMRLPQERAAHEAAKTALRLYHKHLAFDHEYNDQDSSKMYCTELILYAYQATGIDLSTESPENIEFPIIFKGYLPSAIHKSPLLVSISKF